jgi:hypothetical protein
LELPASASADPDIRRILDRANVVIYDRDLAEAVAAILPLGTYAEPAAPAGEFGDPTALRAARFAADGWSVVRLVAARASQRDRVGRIRRLADALAATPAQTDLAATVYAEAGDGVCEPTETRLSRLDLVVVTYPRDARLTIVIQPSADAVATAGPRLRAVAGNGLAG